MTIPSPYNFVPLSEHVFFPGYDNQISHDIPFSDGCSGHINIEVTAETPVYVRNGGDHPETNIEKIDSDEYQSFFKVTQNGDFAIPGTTIRGMLRNIVEIASFSKMARVDDHRYSIRDLANAQLYRKHMTTPNAPYASRCKAGWLKEDNESWKIQPCEFARVEIKDLQNYSGVNNLGNKQSSKDKYNKWGQNGSRKVDFSLMAKNVHRHGKFGNVKLRYNKVSELGCGNQHGTIVFTGQPTPYNPSYPRRGRKHMEFVFYNEKNQIMEVPDRVKKDFDFIHSDANGKPLEEWGYWKRSLNSGVPVFYLEEQGKVKAMGLAMMFRLPYDNSIGEAVDNTSSNHRHSGDHLDMAEAIFGRIQDKEALRGRIFIETALCKDTTVNSLPTEETVLGSPKPTYYPNYVRQNVKNGKLVGDYKTYMDDDVEIRGWKRYWVRPQQEEPNPVPPPLDRNGRINYDTVTRFKPLPGGTKFTTRINFHNIRKAELGAVIWALKWGNDGKLRHQIGMAKPYGFGTVKIDVNEQHLIDYNGNTVDVDGCMNEFVELMEKFASEKGIGTWKESEQIKSLRCMANPAEINNNRKRYPSLGMERGGTNEFVQYKKEMKFLPFCVTPQVNHIGNGPVGKKEHDFKKSAEKIRSLQSKKAAKKIRNIKTISKDDYALLEEEMNKRSDANETNPNSLPSWKRAMAELKSKIR